MEVLFFEPVYKDYIWGGTKLKEYFGKQTTTDITAESWEISTNADGTSKIKGKDITLKDIFDNKGTREKIFGTKTKDMEKFPLLIKFIDANSNLSVQVHPDDQYAKENENDTGKTEMWYIIDCFPNSQIICGMKEEVQQEDVEGIIRNNKIKENLNYVDIKKGDSIYIPSGTIHSILGGALICEIQQNSNLTYRVYDWDRVGSDGKPRVLHIDKAIDVINVNANPKVEHKKQEECYRVCDSEFFKVDKIDVQQEYKDKSNKESFYAINIIEGIGTIEYQNNICNLKRGDSIIIPAKLGEYTIKGKMELLKSYID